MPRRLRTACAGLGGDYGGSRLALLLLALLYVGARRLEHLQYLVGDPLLRRFSGLQEIIHTLTRTKFEVDLTPRVAELVKRAGVREGICTVFVRHATAAVIINENADAGCTGGTERAKRGEGGRAENERSVNRAFIASTL